MIHRTNERALRWGAVFVFFSLLAQGCYELRPRAERRATDDVVDDGAASIDDAASDDAALEAALTDATPDARADVALDATADAGTDASDAARDALSDALSDAQADVVLDARADVVTMCAAGFERLGETCVPIGAAPRPIFPLSLGDVTRRRPTLRWELPLGMDGAVVDLCRDRACTVMIESIRATGTSALPTAQLPTRTAVFWRLRGTSGAATSSRTSATWLFHVLASSVTTAVDTSSNPHFDCNGDGFDDLVVAAPNANPGGRITAGTVSVFMGSATGVSSSPTLVLEGATAGEHFGNGVAGAGDVNGDGFADLVVGAASATVMVGAEARSNAGRAQVFHGSAAGLRAAPSLALSGVAMDDNFGHGVSAAGDVDGDGYGDVLIAAPLTATSRGTVGVYHGRAAGLLSTPSTVLTGSDVFSQFGLAVAHAGDVNGDGFSDIAVALPLAPYASPSTGQVRVYFGASVGIRAASSLLLQGVAHADRFGRSLAGAVDVNNDGYSDLVVGAFRADIGAVTDAGSAYVFHGRSMGIDTTPSATLTAPMPAGGDYFGYAVASVGDSNGDGYGDIAVAAHNADPGGRSDAGIVALFHGSASGITTIARVLEGASGGEYFGAGLGFVGDLNADGYMDLAVGSPNGGAGGRAAVFHGASAGISAAPTRTLSAPASGDAFGTTVASRRASIALGRCSRGELLVR